MNQQVYLYRISQLLSRFNEQVKILNNNSEFSINIHAENTLIQVLNTVYNCDLENVNYSEGKTYPSIDLRDKTNRISFQITSNGNLEKVKETIEKYIKNDLHKEYDTLYVYIITEKEKKYNATTIKKITNDKLKFNTKNILDKTDIYIQLNKDNNLEKIKKVVEILEKQFTDISDLSKWTNYLKGMNEYDDYIKAHYKYLDIKGFSPKINNTRVKINLDDVYIPLKLRENESYPENKSNKKIEEFDVLKALNKFSKLVILGDPGSGKTTILKYLAYDLCKNRELNGEMNDFVPILIKGSSYAKYIDLKLKNLSEYIVDHIDKKYELLFSQKLEVGKVILLIDGIDEINNISLRNSVVESINEFISHYPKIKIIVSSRIVGYNETRLNGHFCHLEVMKFDIKQIEQFITNWYNSVEISTDNTPLNSSNQIKNLLNAIRQNKSIQNMACNPLLITIITLIYYQGASLPEKRVSLYDIATQTFLENWVKLRDNNRKQYFDKDTLISILAPISYYIHENYTTGLIEENKLRELFKKEYKSLDPYLSAKDENTHINEMIDFLREDAGFLFEKGVNENGQSLFGFVHLTFQEYFTAIEFKTRWKEGYFKSNLHEYIFNSTWNEVIKITASMFKYNEPVRIGKKSTTEFISDILKVADPLPELYRPLKIVFSILIDETEIDFSVLDSLIDILFSTILSKPYNHTNNIEDLHFRQFKRILELLFKTRTYQNFLLNRIEKELKSEETNETTKKNILNILMSASENPDIYDKLIEILESDDIELKKHLFNYNIVSPKVKIVKSEKFLGEIIKYINSNEFISNYQGYLPIQYYFSLNSETEYNTRRSPQSEKEKLLFSINLIKNDTIRLKYINFIAFSISKLNIRELNEYINTIRELYKNINLSEIEKHIKKLKKYESYKLEEYPILNFDKKEIYLIENNDSKLAIVENEDIHILKQPLRLNDIKKHFEKESESILELVNILTLKIQEHNYEITPKNIDTFILIKQYENAIHWKYKIKENKLLEFALNNLLTANKENSNIILDWLSTRNITSPRFMMNLSDNFDKKAFISFVINSSHQDHIKLFLLRIVEDNSNFEQFIEPTIKYIRGSISEKERNFILKILYEIF